MPGYSLAIDIGGTFTDIVVYDHERAQSLSHKELTTPEAPARGVMTGIRRLFEQHEIAYADVVRVVHATTLFTNALIERKGAPTGLVVTSVSSESPAFNVLASNDVLLAIGGERVAPLSLQAQLARFRNGEVDATNGVVNGIDAYQIHRQAAVERM